MYNDYGLTNSPNLDSVFTNAVGAIAVGTILLALIAIAIIVLIVIANCFIFKKAGEKSWKGLIPLYNSWVQTKITGLAWWWYLIYVVLYALFARSKNTNGVITIALCLTSFNYNYNLAKKFGKSNGFAFLCTILPFIGLPILGFGSAKYKKDAKVDQNGIFN